MTVLHPFVANYVGAKQAIGETERRRKRQLEYNKKHRITPKTIIKPIPEGAAEIDSADVRVDPPP